MRDDRGLLGGAQPSRRAVRLLRPHRPGDMGWVVAAPRRALRRRNTAGTRSFEALVAEIVAEFISDFDPEPRALLDRRARRRERRLGLPGQAEPTRSPSCGCCWSSRRRAASASAAAWSTSACASRAQAGYRTITLWTNSIWPPRGTSTSGAGFRSSARSRTTASATTWSAKPGNSICSHRRRARRCAGPEPQPSQIIRSATKVMMPSPTQDNPEITGEQSRDKGRSHAHQRDRQHEADDQHHRDGRAPPRRPPARCRATSTDRRGRSAASPASSSCVGRGRRRRRRCRRRHRGARRAVRGTFSRRPTAAAARRPGSAR